MKKIMMITMMVLLLTACTSTEEKTTTQISRGDGSGWWQELGEADTDYWWITEYDENMSE